MLSNTSSSISGSNSFDSTRSALIRHVTGFLGTGHSGRFVLQELTPLAESLEWELGARYLSWRGSRAFLSDPVPVPYAVNNTGALSQHAADLLFTALTTAEADGPLPAKLAVLELGIGLGLFARYFLDAFRDRCTATGKDYYDRLTYVAADRSERMLLDAARHGTFANHSGRYLLRVIDALDPGAAIRSDAALGGDDSPFVAVFLNYLLDCLPAAILRTEQTPSAGEDGAVLRQLCVRTCLARGVNLREYTDYTPDDLARLATSRDPADREQLLDQFRLFTSEYEYRPVRADDLPHGEFALGFTSRHPGTVVHSHGAITCLERLLGLLHPRGFILMNDYGSAEASGEEFEHQRYTGSTFVGVNFAILESYFGATLLDENAGSSEVRWSAPKEESGRIFSRLLGHDLHTDLTTAFIERFSKPAWDRLDQPVQKAKTLAGQGRVELATSSFRTALEMQPWNWLLLCEVANFLTFGMQEPQSGLELARAGLELNPACSAELWNAYGAAAFALGRVDHARHAYERALTVNPDDVQGRFNLSWVFLRKRDHAEALRMIAEGLARDRTGAYRERLMQQQSQVLADLARRNNQEFRTLLNRVSYSPNDLKDRPIGPLVNEKK